MLRKRILWDLLRNSSRDTIDFPIKFIMKNLHKVPNHISIKDEQMYGSNSKKKKKSRKKSNSSRKNIGSAGCSKLLNPPKSRQVQICDFAEVCIS